MTNSVLVTRPDPAAQRTIARLEQRGFRVLHQPLLTIERLEAPLPNGSFDVIIVSSAHAVPALSDHWSTARSLPVLATGQATANALKTAGFTDVIAANGGLIELVGWLVTTDRKPTPRNVLFPRACQTAHDLGALLAPYGVKVENWPVYEAIPADKFSDDVAKAFNEGSVGHVLLYSARTAQTFADLLTSSGNSLGQTRLICLSKAIADSLPSVLQSNCQVASAPSDDAALDCL